MKYSIWLWGNWLGDYNSETLHFDSKLDGLSDDVYFDLKSLVNTVAHAFGVDSTELTVKEDSMT